VAVYGVGLEPPNVVRVLRGGQPVPLLEQTRNQVRVHPLGLASSPMELEVNGQVIGSWTEDPDPGFVHTPSDASTQGGGGPVVIGGFPELQRDDGALLVCTRRDDQTILLQAIVRKMDTAGAASLELELTRSYESTNGTETVRLYDWSSGSYPYGSFVTVSSQPVSSGTMQTLHASVAQHPADLVDDEGTLYVEVETSGAGSGAQLNVDSLRLRLR
jgi:hypothetical protein